MVETTTDTISRMECFLRITTSSSCGVKEAIAMAKAYAPFVRKIEVEVESFDMVKDAVEAGADIIMLDNMSTELLKQCIDYIDGRAEMRFREMLPKKILQE